ncbi:NUDIX hydrolase [Haloarcula sp. CBA1130]|uniref:NUDIX domain-containing protein n=1 Tax=unclassified Haloarcula TaxID=2624677 RepID=UPI001249028A|nr:MULTISPECIES: NUDIX hydrolase [unclassified Haloarcula]KAA9397826.1 NUDIX hydrolase [Haloarcula sp. CBA1129]KAA9402485.1 NUDIX hydrolase [Haloarcula sp. CBA1130]
MPTLAAFEDRDVLTRRVTRETDTAGVDGVRTRADRGLHWAVGALVTDPAERLLFVHEDEIWKLPGGGVEAGETRQEAVRREVREETGIDITVDDLAAVTEVVVTDGGREATFFFGTYRGTADSTALASDPGLDGESIETVAWRDSVPENCLDERLLRRLR